MVSEPIPRLFALVGDPVAGNPTQEIVEAAFRGLGLDWRYVSCRVRPADLPAAIAGLRALGFAGAHVTIPHKVAAAGLVDACTDVAAAIGAVNCIVARDSRFIGDNTDGRGLRTLLARIADLAALPVVLFGAGGAARAAGVELVMAGARDVLLVNRDAARRGDLAATLRRSGAAVEERGWPDVPLRIPGPAVIVNGTSVSMPGHDGDAAIPVDWATLPAGSIAADVVIAPETPFVAAARAAGAEVVTGPAMLVEQAALSIELWTGREPDRDQIDQVLRHSLGLPGGTQS